jgi:ankyrin repeat protein
VLEVRNIVILPSDYVRAAFKANGVDMETVKRSAAERFIEPTQKMLDAYTKDILNSVRLKNGNLAQVQALHERGTLVVNCCNRYSESLLHLACRRGHTEIVRYLLETVQVDIHIRDDYHRTPLHDACWTIEPNYDLVDLLLRIAPEHLLLEDVRGFTPFDYVRPEHRGKWLRFLWERKDLLRPLL